MSRRREIDFVIEIDFCPNHSEIWQMYPQQCCRSPDKFQNDIHINTLRPRQNGRHFTDDTFKRIFMNENVRISIGISLKFVPKGLINNIPALVQIMAWRRPGDKPLSEPMMVNLLTHICVTRPQWVKYPISRVRDLVRSCEKMPGPDRLSGQWYQSMMTSSMKTFSAFLAICAGYSPVTGEFPAQMPVTRSLIFSLICDWINGWVNNREAGDWRRHRAHYDVAA